MAAGDINTVLITHLGKIQPPAGKSWLVKGQIGNGLMRVGTSSSVYVEVRGSQSYVVTNSLYGEWHKSTGTTGTALVTYVELD